MSDVILETDRLMMRPPRIEDFGAWCAFMSDEEAARHIGGVQAPPVAWRGMATVAGSWALLGYGMFSLIEKSSLRWVGRAGPWQPAGWPGAEIGWGIVREKWGEGLATEAATAAIDFAVDELGWTDIIHCIDPANVNSQRVAMRLGSQNRGTGRLPAPFDTRPVDIWGQTAASWKARRR